MTAGGEHGPGPAAASGAGRGRSRDGGDEGCTPGGSGVDHGDDPAEGDDEAVREEQRERYQELLQELRVILPGIEVLAGFLFTVPFATGFRQLDEVGRVVFAVSLVSATSATIAFLTPTAFHRVAESADRAARIRIGVRMAVVGLVFVAVALISAMFVVTRLVYGSTTAAIITAGIAGAITVAWWVLPSRYRHRADAGSGRGAGHDGSAACTTRA